MTIFSQIYDKGDFVLRTSLYFAAKLLLLDVSKDDRFYYNVMIKECWLDKIVWNRKSMIYRWSNSGSAAESENTLMKRPTKWIYNHLLKYFKINPFKGLSGDQMRAYILSLYLENNWRGVLRVKLGFIIRLGMTPSLCEFAPLKPQAYVLLFKTKYPYYIHYLWYPIYLICKLFFYFSYNREIKISINKSTTNKITMLPTALILGFKLPGKEYIKLVYKEYFKDNIVGEVMSEALCRYLVK